jgi:hypothetical protein
MQAYQIMSPIRLSKYVILFPNGCTKLAARRGFRMRKVSRYTESLSGHRLMTQLEITASAKSSGKYDSAKSPTTNSTKSVRPASATACVARSIIGCAKSTTTTFPPGAILRAAKITSMPAPHPKSTTTSPARRSGLLQPLESLTASSGTDAKSSECKDPAVQQTRRQVGLRSDNSKNLHRTICLGGFAVRSLTTRLISSAFIC